MVCQIMCTLMETQGHGNIKGGLLIIVLYAESTEMSLE